MLRSSSHGAIHPAGDSATNSAAAAHAPQVAFDTHSAQDICTDGPVPPRAAMASPTDSVLAPAAALETRQGGVAAVEDVVVRPEHNDDGMVSVPLDSPADRSEGQSGPLTGDGAAVANESQGETPSAAAAAAGAGLLSQLAGADVMLDDGDMAETSASAEAQPQDTGVHVGTASHGQSGVTAAALPAPAPGRHKREDSMTNGPVQEEQPAADEAAAETACEREDVQDPTAAALADIAAMREQRDAALAQVKTGIESTLQLSNAAVPRSAAARSIM